MHDHIDQTEEEVEIEAIGIEVDSQPIELYKVLKIADVVAGGGEAKYAISEGYVAVNGELELRKRRKLYDGDLIEFNEEYYLIICDAPVTEPEARMTLDAKAEKSATHKKRPKPETKHADKSKAAPNKQNATSKGKSRNEKPAGKAKSSNAKSSHGTSGWSQSATGTKRVKSTDATAAEAKDTQPESQKPTEGNQGGRGSIHFF